MSFDDLLELAVALNVQVCWHKGGNKGLWVPSRRTVSLRLGLSPIAEKCVLAHELGHARYGHPSGCDPRFEAKADRFAAQLLISPAEYAAAEALYGSHPGSLARELGVTVHLIQVWRTLNTNRELSAKPPTSTPKMHNNSC